MLGGVKQLGLHRFGTLALLLGLAFENGVFGSVVCFRRVVVAALVLRMLWPKEFVTFRKDLERQTRQTPTRIIFGSRNRVICEVRTELRVARDNRW
jgi:hypothetical protein